MVIYKTYTYTIYRNRSRLVLKGCVLFNALYSEIYGPLCEQDRLSAYL